MPNPSCGRPKSKDYIDHLYHLRLIYCLNGLNESYDQERRQILLKGGNPIINQAYAMKTEDEIQHSACLASVNEKSKSIAMQINRSQGYNHGSQNYKGMKCGYRHFTEHTKKNCYELIDYLTDLKSRRKPGYNGGNEKGHGYSYGHNKQGYGYVGGHGGQTNINAQKLENNVTRGNIGIASTSHKVNNAFVAKGHTFTEGECKQIMDILNKDTKDMKQFNMTSIITTCFSCNTFYKIA